MKLSAKAITLLVWAIVVAVFGTVAVVVLDTFTGDVESLGSSISGFFTNNAGGVGIVIGAGILGLCLFLV